MDALLTGLLTINDQDAWRTWHTFLSDEGRSAGSLSSLLQPATAKPIPTVSYPEESGERYPSTIKIALEPRELTLGFAICASSASDYMAYYTELLRVLRSGIVRLRVREIERTYSLIYQSCTAYKQLTLVAEGDVVGRFDIKFIEPSPSY